jgi:hypothetical protein
VWEAVWPVIQPALTPELVGGVVVTLAGTHAVKIWAAAYYPSTTETLARWRAFCTATSVVIGTLAGTAIWALTPASWAAVPIVALVSGPIWRLAQALLPARVAAVFLTETDRCFRDGH